MSSSSPFRMVASDMDGTVLNSRHNMSTYTMETLFQLAVRHGVQFIFATGRHHLSVAKAQGVLSDYFAKRYSEYSASQLVYSKSDSVAGAVHDAHPLEAPVAPGFFLVTSNGARIHDPKGKLRVEHNLDPDIVQALYMQYGLPYTSRRGPDVVVARALGSSPCVAVESGPITSPTSGPMEGDDENPEEPVSTSAYTTEEWYISSLFMPMDEMERKFGIRPFVVPFDPSLPANAAGTVFDGFPLEGVGKVCFRCSDMHILDSMERHIREQFGDRVSVALSSTRCLDVMAGGISKASALREIVALFNSGCAPLHREADPPLTMNDVIAFGDSMNDEAMLAMAGTGCIMKNGHHRLKVALPQCQVVGANDADGVAVKLREVFQLPLNS